MKDFLLILNSLSTMCRLLRRDGTSFYDIYARHTWATTARNRDVLAPLYRMARGLQRSACNVPIIGVAMAEVTPDLIEMLELLEYICYLCIE